MSRLALSIKNAWIALVFHFVYIVIQFYSRNIFLDVLGDDFIGVVGTLKSILQFLNLSELGIGAAVGFSLYKPIYEKNQDKINEIIGYLGFLYKRIGFFLLGAGLVLILFFPYIFQNTNINLGIIIFLFFALLTSNLLNYFFAYHMFLMEADQRSYMIVTINQSVFVLRLALQCLVLLYFESVLWWIFLELATPFIYIYILRKKIKMTYPWLIFRYKATKEIRQRNKALLTKIKQLSFHKIGGFVSNGTDNIVIFSFINPATVAFVGNYQLIMNNINTLVGQFFNGTKAGVGNLVAENDKENMMKVFWEMMALRFFLAGCAAVCLYLGFDDLITIWVGKRYLMSHYVLLALITIFFILQVRTPVDTYIQAFGLYGDVWAPLVQSIINLVFSIVLVINYGVIGIFLGTIISQVVIILIWRPYHLFWKGFDLKQWVYWRGFLGHFLLFSISIIGFYAISDWINIEASTNLFYLLLKLTRLGLVFSVLYFVILLIFSQGFRDLLNRFIYFAKQKLNKKN
jgi:O-antigen/teichoic acid export membrane protein